MKSRYDQQQNTISADQSRVHLSDLNQNNSLLMSQATLIKKKQKGTYQNACNAFQKSAYRKKLGDLYYEQYMYLGSNQQIKQFGIGIYLFIQFLRRIAYLYLFIAIFSAFPVGFNFLGNRLDQYFPSSNHNLSKTTIGNLSSPSSDNVIIYIITIPDAINTLLFLIFIVYWKTFTNQVLKQYFNNPKFSDPRKYSIEVKGFRSGDTEDEELRKFIDKHWPCYQANVVYDYNGRLLQFKQIQQLNEQISKQQLRLKIGQSQNDDQLKQLIQKRQKLELNLTNYQFDKKVLHAYIHLQYSIDKKAIINYYQKYYQTNSFKSCFCKNFCCCCKDQMPQQYLWQGQQLQITQLNPPHPQQINWQNLDTTLCFRIIRGFFIVIIIFALLLISSGIISILNLYVNQSEDCINFNPQTTLNKAKQANNQTITYCFCNSNLLKIQQTDIQNYCQDIRYTILIQNVMQLMAPIVSGIINGILVLIIALLIPCIRPESKSLSLRTNMLFIFIATFINTVCVPLFLNSEIYNINPARIISFIYQLKDFKFYSDYTADWYYYIGPYYMNFMIYSVSHPVVQLIKAKLIKQYKHYTSRRDNQKVIQKQLDQRLTSYQLYIPQHIAHCLLLIFMSMAFSSGMPVVNIACFFSLTVKYLVLKYILFYYTVRIKGMNDTINNWLTRILPAALILHLLFGVWMFTAPDIFSQNQFSDFNTVLNTGIDIVDRYLLIPFLLALLGIVILYIFIEFFVSCFSFIKQSLCPTPNAQLNFRGQSFSKKSFNLGGLFSYDIHKNDDYIGCAYHIQTLYNNQKHPNRETIDYD